MAAVAATTIATEPKLTPEHAADAVSSDEEEVAGEGGEGAAGAAKKKKKKKKAKKSGKKRAALGAIPAERTPALNETDEEKSKWEEALQSSDKVALDMWGLLSERERPKLNILRTPACAAFALETPRLVLRQVETADTTAIRRIKMEPIVQKTQLYGTPSASEIKDSFTRRYVASSIPRLARTGTFRDDYIFAITAKDGAGIQVAPPGTTRIANRITTADGYLGNIALTLETADAHHDHSGCGSHGHSHAPPDPAMSPQAKSVWVHPTAADCTRVQLVGKMFYELHPQVWGQGIVSEAFAEVLRFAFEEVGVTAVSADPTAGNDASIRICEKFGMAFSHESTDNAFHKPQLFHTITREQWFKRNRGGVPAENHWAGKEVCRWCTDPRTRPAVTCSCGWAKYCSRECQRADYLVMGGHKAECGK